LVDTSKSLSHGIYCCWWIHLNHYHMVYSVVDGYI